MADELAKKDSFSTQLTTMLIEVKDALPDGFNIPRFVQNAVALLNDNESLKKFAQTNGTAQIKQGLLKGAYLGLDAMNKECYLIPYGNTLSFMIDYRGNVKLAKKYSPRKIRDIYAKLVRRGDDFVEGVVNGYPTITHTPLPFNTNEIVGAYAVCLYEDGGMIYDTMSLEDLENSRKASKASNSPAWTRFTGEMYKKGLSIDTPILTPKGYVPMGDIFVGDTVFDMDGKKTTVTDVSEIKLIKCFEVVFSDGERLICDDEHRWIAKIGQHANREEYKTYTVNELLEAKKSGKGVSIPVCGPVEFDEKDLLIPPYILGYWIGNGSKGHANITCDSKDADEICNLIKEHSNGKYNIGAKYISERSNAVTIGIRDGLLRDLRDLEVLNNKHIPDAYLTASYQQRIDLLKGLMDSDGTISKNRGQAIFTTVNYDLANKVYQLVSSLGEKAHINARLQKGFMKEVVCYYVSWKPNICPVSLKRKADNFVPRKLCTYRSVKAINEIDSVPTKCIAVSSPTKSYLAGYGCIPTHNTVLHRLCKNIVLEFDNPKQREYFAEDMAIETDTRKIVEAEIAENANKEEFIDVDAEVIEDGSEE